MRFVQFPNVTPQRVDFRLIHNTVSAPASIATGTRQVQTKPGTAWACRFEWSQLNDAKRHQLRAFIASMRGGAAVTHLHDFSSTKSGAVLGAHSAVNFADEPTSDSIHFVNPSGSSYMTAQPATCGGLRMTRSLDETLASRIDIQIMGLTENTEYNIDFDVSYNGFDSVQWVLRQGIGGSLIGSYVNIDTDGEHISGSFTCPAGETICTLLIRSPNNDTGDVVVNNLRVSPVSVTVGAGPSVNTAIISGLVASTANALKAAAMVNVNGQLVRLINDASSDEDGNALISFEPAMRSAIAGGEKVTLYKPGALFRLVNPETAEPAQPGIFQSFAFEFIEMI